MILTAPILLTMRPGAGPIINGAISLRGSTILDVGPGKRIIDKFPKERVMKLENAVLLPGLVNAHTHLELPALLEETRAGGFADWVMNLIEAKKKLHDKDYLSSTLRNIETLTRTGTTTVGEICTHNISPAALRACGLRAVVYHEIITMSDLAARPRSLRFIKSRAEGLIKSGVSPHAPHTVSETALTWIRDIARKKNLPLCMHVAESRDELGLLQRKKSGLERLYGFAGWDTAQAPRAKSPFEYLGKLGLLNKTFLAVHAVHASDSDIALLKKTGAPVAHCPRSNKEIGAGRMRLKDFMDAGIPVGIGTDGLASSPSLSIWDELRYARKIHRRDGISAREMLGLGTIGGAKALGLEKEIGTLAPGKKADIIAVPLPQKSTGDIYNDLLRETECCIMMMVNGKLIGKWG